MSARPDTTATLAAGIDDVLIDFAQLVGATDAVTVVGHRTRDTIGGALHPGTRELAAPSGVVDHDPAEMTVRVRAGTPVADLAALLASAGQRCALPDRGGTVGGAVAVGENHLEVHGRGRLRAAVLQVRYVSAEGQVITGGGPTVKNVSGFDLPRLMCGALGTLGLIAEVTLRTNPIPAVQQWVRVAAAPIEVANTILRPGCVLFDGTSTHVLVEGHAPDVHASIRDLERLGACTTTDGPPELGPHRWSLPAAEALAPATYGHDTGASVAVVQVGTVFAARPQPPRSPDAASMEIGRRLRERFDPTGRLNPGRNPLVR